MPVSVHLDFIPPDVPDLTTLKIYEAPVQGGPYTVIETITPVGTQGSYITEYTTNMATSLTDWFAIEWIDSKGASFGVSQGVQGGVESLVSEIVDRVMLRDPSVNEGVAGQEAEAVVEKFYGATDPLAMLKSDATASELSGLTLLTLVRSKIATISSSSTSTSYTAGLVSQSGGSGASTSFDALAKLLEQANEMLGTSFSVILQLADNEIAGGAVIETLPDQSRLLVEVL
jgi:hypothetical protein